MLEIDSGRHFGKDLLCHALRLLFSPNNTCIHTTVLKLPELWIFSNFFRKKGDFDRNLVCSKKGLFDRKHKH